VDLIHGTWIPDLGDDFVQGGGFYLWVETDAAASGRRRRGEAPVHPRHRTASALASFLDERLHLGGAYPAALARSIVPLYYRLPSTDRGPLPAYELLPYLDASVPEAFTFAWWQVAGWRVPRVIPTLNEIHFAALHAADEFQLGTDLLFWHRFSQELQQVVQKDQYLPALVYRELPAGNGRSAPAVEIHPGWEIRSDAFDAALRRYATLLPAVGAAGALQPGGEEIFERESLLRHFSECLLQQIVGATPIPATLDQKIVGTLLEDVLHPGRVSTARTPEAALKQYRQWAAWRGQLVRAPATGGFSLGLRLAAPSVGTTDDWRVHFLVAGKHDPSYQLTLAEYWALGPAERAEATRFLGEDFEKHLLLALGYAARIYPKVWAGLETDQPTGLTLTLDEAYAFLKETAAVLTDAGFTVIVPSWWTPQGRRRAKLRLRTASRTGRAAAAAAGGYFNRQSVVSYEYQLAIGGEPISDAEWRQLVAAKTPLVQFRGEWMAVDRDKLQQLLALWQARQQESPELSLPELLHLLAENDDDLEWDHDPTLQAMLARLADPSAFAPVDDPPGLRGSLRDYQKRGVAWLRYLESLGLNPCLADDMGLGKTLEVIAHLVHEQDQPGDHPPTLVVAPTSVLGNWRKEIERFAPQLRAVVHHGSGRPKRAADFQAACAEADVVITSYALARLDEPLLAGVPWRRVVLDEAQNVKNPQSAQARAVRKLNAPHRLALTGTPIENRLLDLWSIFSFLNPGYLGKEAHFRKRFEVPIQKDHDGEQSAVLRKLVEPFILRRVKTDQRIIADLPDKIEQKVFCNLTTEQASLYAAVVKDVEEQLTSAEGMQRRGLILATLLKLKQVCNHPAQLLQDGSPFLPERSHKLQRLVEMVEEALADGDSLLVFTQFTEIGGALDEFLRHQLRCPTYYLHGGTSQPRREQLIAAFQDPESDPAVFILSLRAGGVGLNLTHANHVFHFDRWWNPAVEDQATDRAFRIGQRKNVFVHKFVAVGTVEEKIDQLIEDKKQLSGAIVGSDESWLTELDNDAFKELIALRREAVLE
jgi:SNF2 family DNA or RNA helicase